MRNAILTTLLLVVFFLAACSSQANVQEVAEQPTPIQVTPTPANTPTPLPAVSPIQGVIDEAEPLLTNTELCRTGEQIQIDNTLTVTVPLCLDNEPEIGKIQVAVVVQNDNGHYWGFGIPVRSEDQLTFYKVASGIYNDRLVTGYILTSYINGCQFVESHMFTLNEDLQSYSLGLPVSEGDAAIATPCRLGS